MQEQLKNHVVLSLTSKKFVTVLYSLTWLFAILLIVILKSATPSETIVNALLLSIASVFGAFVTGNIFADHNGKSVPNDVKTLPPIAVVTTQDATTTNNNNTIKPAGGN